MFQRSQAWNPKLLLLVALVFATSQQQLTLLANDEDEGMRKRGAEILKKYCYECHGAEIRSFDASDPGSLTNEKSFGHRNPTESEIYKKIVSKEMPPEESSVKITDEERNELIRWIEEQRAAPPTTTKPTPTNEKYDYINEKYIFSAIASRLMSLESQGYGRETLANKRYFSLVHVRNNIENINLPKNSVTDDKPPQFVLDMTKAALSKLLNSLSLEPMITTPIPIDQEELVLEVDLRDYGWQRKEGNIYKWSIIEQRNPYDTLFYKANNFAIERQMQERFDAVFGTENVYLRADWFIFHASRAPLYNLLLDLPVPGEIVRDAKGENAKVNDIRSSLLRIDPKKSFREGKAKRAAFLESGISDQVRTIERLPTPFGGYWQSFDFEEGAKMTNSTNANKPFGPLNYFDGDENKREILKKFSFAHAGGEFIFHLPNGTFAYLVTDSSDNPIAVAPEKIVLDDIYRLGKKGSSGIVNAVSCFGCHANGLRNEFLRREGDLVSKKWFKESDNSRPDLKRIFENRTPEFVRDIETLETNNLLTSLKELYPGDVEIKEIIAKDNRKYIDAIEQSISPFLARYALENGGTLSATYEKNAEPIVFISKLYDSNVSIESLCAMITLTRQRTDRPFNKEDTLDLLEKNAGDKIASALELLHQEKLSVFALEEIFSDIRQVVLNTTAAFE